MKQDKDNLSTGNPVFPVSKLSYPGLPVLDRFKSPFFSLFNLYTFKQKP